MVVWAPVRSASFISRLSRWSASALVLTPLAVATAMSPLSWASVPAAVLISTVAAMACWDTDWVNRSRFALLW